ncbi:hypothetical protein [Robertkochia sediminum]|uniref:hypothetical protein n=1 Tax=Robertkochia sediminum TaxID=2785326 RepID=UPI001932FBCB|nr:hypothetical protein [Robertkochia sediminum]MBL7471387.1 hypothetical protein [Robertkochia sediminum]
MTKEPSLHEFIEHGTVLFYLDLDGDNPESGDYIWMYELRGWYMVIADDQAYWPVRSFEEALANEIFDNINEPFETCSKVLSEEEVDNIDHEIRSRSEHTN